MEAKGPQSTAWRLPATERIATWTAAAVPHGELQRAARLSWRPPPTGAPPISWLGLSARSGNGSFGGAGPSHVSAGAALLLDAGEQQAAAALALAAYAWHAA